MMLAVGLVIGDCLIDILSSFIDDFVMNKLDTSIIRHLTTEFKPPMPLLWPIISLEHYRKSTMPCHSGSTWHYQIALHLLCSIFLQVWSSFLLVCNYTKNYLLPMIFFFLILHALYTLIIFRLCSQRLKDRLHSRLTGYAAPGAA